MCRLPYRKRVEPQRHTLLAEFSAGIRLVLTNDSLSDSLVDAMLDPLLCRLTEIDGKYRTRFRSTTVFEDVEYRVDLHAAGGCQ